MLSVWTGLKITNYKGICKAKDHKSLKTAFLGTTLSVPVRNFHSSWQTVEFLQSDSMISEKFQCSIRTD